MSRFYGPIGFITSEEIPEGSGIWVEVPIEKMYRGTVVRNYKRFEDGSSINKNLNISNSISIVADPYISNHLNSVRYIKWLGGYWSVTGVDVQFPRLVLNIGGVYNGPTVGASSEIGEHPRIE